MASDDLTMAAVSALRPGQDVIGVFACVRKDRLTTRTGSAYLALELRDRTGTVPARAFQNADALAGRFERGDIVRVRARVERFRDALTLEVLDVAKVSDDVDPGQFLPTAYRDLDELDGFLEHLSSEVYDRGYRALLDSLLADEELRTAWRRAPCTRGGHHAYLGGLLEHTVAVATLAHETCQLHPRLNSDLLICAALVHDLGPHARVHLRGRDRPHRRGPDARPRGHRRADAGRAHRPSGRRSRRAVSEAAKLALLHCVLSHHGPASAPGGRFASRRGARPVPPQRARRDGQGRARARPARLRRSSWRRLGRAILRDT